MVRRIIEYLVQLITTIGYAGVGISMFIESFFAPIPSELIMPFAGFVASSGELSLLWVVLVGGMSSFLGSLPFYFIGYYGQEILVNKFLKKFGKFLFITSEEIDTSLDYFNKYGNTIVLIGRLIPMIRTVISFPAGISKMKFIPFAIYTIIGSTLWSGILAYAGYMLGQQWSLVSIYVERYQNVVIYGFLAIAVIYITAKLYRRKK